MFCARRGFFILILLPTSVSFCYLNQPFDIYLSDINVWLDKHACSWCIHGYREPVYFLSHRSLQLFQTVSICLFSLLWQTVHLDYCNINQYCVRWMQLFYALELYLTSNFDQPSKYPLPSSSVCLISLKSCQ